MFRPFLRPSSGMLIQKCYKEEYKKIKYKAQTRFLNKAALRSKELIVLYSRHHLYLQHIKTDIHQAKPETNDTELTGR